jgi:hypothetical protein
MINRVNPFSICFAFLLAAIQLQGAYAAADGTGSVISAEVQVFGPSKVPAGAARQSGSTSTPTGVKNAASGGEATTAQPGDGKTPPPGAEPPQSGDMSSESQGAVTTETPSETVNEKGQSGTPPTSGAPPPNTTHSPPPDTPAAPESRSKVPAPAVPEEKKFVVLRGVLQAFREYTGEENQQSLTTLFGSVSNAGVRQEPPVVLSDGKTTVKLFIQAPAVEKVVHSFYLSGAKLVSLETQGAAWIVQVLPDAGVYEASVTVLSNGSTTEIPITVAPPIDVDAGSAIGLGEKEFNVFLKERGTEKAPRFDLNKDGKRDYVDDYIFTANFIVKRHMPPDTQTKQNK